MNAKLTQFQEKTRQGQEKAEALKGASYEKPYTFRKHGNEEQVNFNTKVDEALE